MQTLAIIIFLRQFFSYRPVKQEKIDQAWSSTVGGKSYLLKNCPINAPFLSTGLRKTDTGFIAFFSFFFALLCKRSDCAK